jgi:predicted transcriptional regulator
MVSLSIEEDIYCVEIISLLMFEKELGLNELFRLVKDRYGFSRPTLSFHLKHLVRKGWLHKRTERKSRSHIKPCLYSLNREMLRKQIPQMDTIMSNYKYMDENLDKLTAVQMAYRLVETLIILDMVQVKLYLQSIGNETERRTLAGSLSIMRAMAQTMMVKLRRSCEKATQEDISKAIRDLDEQIASLLP